MTYYDDVEDRTRSIYDRLPEAYRDADQGLDYPLLRYLSLLLDQLEPVAVLEDRITYDEGGTSDLVDAATGNAGWFPWLAQLLGVDLTGLTIAQQRAALAAPSTSWDHGTPGAIADAAKAGLTGTKSVVVTPHYTGDPFRIGIGTKTSENVLADTWGELKAVAPTWAVLKALGSFSGAKSSGPILAAERERPAGCSLILYSTGP